MNRVKQSIALLLVLAPLAGCRMPGKPKPGAIPLRPDQVISFQVLYRQNCAGCHGDQGIGGASVALANPAYVAYAGFAPIQAITANGIPQSLMPAFAKSAGGLLTDQQVAILANGIVAWGNAAGSAALHPPPYQSTATGDAARGAALYQADCLRCHAPGAGSVLDPVYLSLISEGGLRTLIVAGKPHEGMPDWRGYPRGPLSNQQVADLVTFLVSHRRPTTGVKPSPETSNAAAQAADPGPAEPKAGTQ